MSNYNCSNSARGQQKPCHQNRSFEHAQYQGLRTGHVAELFQFTLLTYLLTPWCRVLLEKLTGLQLVKEFPAFYGTRRFITTLTSVRHLSLSWASPIQSIYPHRTSWRSILILSTHLRLGLPSGSLRFPHQDTIHPLSSPIHATCHSSPHTRIKYFPINVIQLSPHRTSVWTFHAVFSRQHSVCISHFPPF